MPRVLKCYGLMGIFVCASQTSLLQKALKQQHVFPLTVLGDLWKKNGYLNTATASSSYSSSITCYNSYLGCKNNICVFKVLPTGHVPFSVCETECPLVAWGGWWLVCEHSSWLQVWWRQAARRAHRPGSGPQPAQGNPVRARHKCLCDTAEQDREHVKSSTLSYT